MSRIASLSAYGFPYTVDPGITRSSDFLPVQAVNAAHYLRVEHAGRISKIATQIGTQGGNMSLAVYRNSGSGREAVPGTRLATTGSFVTPAAGYAEFSLGTTLNVQVGDWFALTCDSTVATFKSQLASGGDSNLGKGRQYRQATAHPAPATVGTLVATQGYTFVIVGVA